MKILQVVIILVRHDFQGISFLSSSMISLSAANKYIGVLLIVFGSHQFISTHVNSFVGTDTRHTVPMFAYFITWSCSEIITSGSRDKCQVLECWVGQRLSCDVLFHLHHRELSSESFSYSFFCLPEIVLSRQKF